jgi:hypothetical protein
MAGNQAPRNMIWGTTNPVQIECPGLSGDRFNGAVYQDNRWEEYENTIMYVDPAGRGEDQTGYCVARLLNGLIHIPECDGLDGGHEDSVLGKLADIAAFHNVKAVVVESNWGDGMYAKLLIPHLLRVGNIAVEEKRNTGQKEIRIIDTLEPAMAQHRICISHKVASNMVLGNQITRITRDKGSLRHDDQIEAMAGAVAWFKDQMALDSSRRIQDMDTAKVEQVAKEFLKEYKKPTPSRWVLPVTGGLLGRRAREEWNRGRGVRTRWGV